MPKIIDQIQERYKVLAEQIEIAMEEQHRLCEKLMDLAEAHPDQNLVDWSVVREAVIGTCDEHGVGGPIALEVSFKRCGLLVMHGEDAAAALAAGPHDHDHL